MVPEETKVSAVTVTLEKVNESKNSKIFFLNYTQGNIFKSVWSLMRPNTLKDLLTRYMSKIRHMPLWWLGIQKYL